MSANFEPNPPTRKPGGFPKTNTFPENWVLDNTVANRASNKDHTSDYSEENMPASDTSSGDSPFARKLEPFPTKAETHGSML